MTTRFLLRQRAVCAAAKLALGIDIPPADAVVKGLITAEQWCDTLQKLIDNPDQLTETPVVRRTYQPRPSTLINQWQLMERALVGMAAFGQPISKRQLQALLAVPISRAEDTIRDLQRIGWAQNTQISGIPALYIVAGDINHHLIVIENRLADLRALEQQEAA